jgi:hypothetical protein
MARPKNKRADNKNSRADLKEFSTALTSAAATGKIDVRGESGG